MDKFITRTDHEMIGATYLPKVSFLAFSADWCWYAERSSVGGTIVQNTSVPQTSSQGFTYIGVLTCGSLKGLDFIKL